MKALYTETFAIKREYFDKNQSPDSPLGSTRIAFIQIRNFNEILLLGIDQWIDDSLKKIENDIQSLKNPTKEEKNIYTEYFFQERIKLLKETREFYKSWKLNEEKKVQVYNIFKKSALKAISSLGLNKGEMMKILKAKKISYDDLIILKNEHNYNEIKKNNNFIKSTCYPKDFISPKDKISNLLLTGNLDESPRKIAMEKKGQKPITTIANINLNTINPTINSKLNYYDWQVHNSIVSLYIDGGNEYITPLMIHRVMSANPRAEITNVSRENIQNSIEKLSSIRITIDAKEELKYYNLKDLSKLQYKGNLIYTKTITAEYKGNTGEWIYIMEPPILYQYASSKNQITRMPLNLLNTPINKNKENIIIQGYLQKRILDMKGSKLSRNILYETLYKQIDLTHLKPNSLRKKHAKIRNSVYRILDYWEKEQFIKGYKENIGKNNAKKSLTILLD